jgi:hypothetical protein
MQQHLEPRIAADVIELLQRTHPESLLTYGELQELVHTAIGDCFHILFANLGGLQTDPAAPASATPPDDDGRHDRVHASRSANPARDQSGNGSDGSYHAEMRSEKPVVAAQEPAGNLLLMSSALAPPVSTTPGMAVVTTPMDSAARTLPQGTIRSWGPFYAGPSPYQHQAYSSWPAPAHSWNGGFQGMPLPATNTADPTFTFAHQQMLLASNPPDWARDGGLVEPPSTLVFDSCLPNHFSALNRREPHGETNSMLDMPALDARLGFDPSTYGLSGAGMSADRGAAGNVFGHFGAQHGGGG